jgi:hypothetical protein
VTKRVVGVFARFRAYLDYENCFFNCRKLHQNKAFSFKRLSLGNNLTSLSRNIMSELESEFGKEVKQGAIVMSLKD